MNVFSRCGTCPSFKAWRNIWFGLFGSGNGKEPETRKMHSELKILGLWATVGGAGLEHKWDEMLKERCTKNLIWEGFRKLEGREFF